MRHDRERNAGQGTNAFGDDRHEHRVVRMHRCHVVSTHDALDDRDIAGQVGLDRLIRQLDHGDHMGEFVVPVGHIHGQGVAKPRLVHHATCGVRRIPLEQCRHGTVVLIHVGGGDEVIEIRMALLAHQMDGVSITAQRAHDGTGPQVAAGTFEQVPVQDADHATPGLLRVAEAASRASRTVDAPSTAARAWTMEVACTCASGMSPPETYGPRFEGNRWGAGGNDLSVLQLLEETLDEDHVRFTSAAATAPHPSYLP